MKPINRRDFIRTTSWPVLPFPYCLQKVVFGKSNSKLRLGFIGTGLRGQGLLSLALKRDDTEVPAICDIQQVMLDGALRQFDKAEKPHPTIYDAGDFAYRELLAREDIDAVIIATPWRWHFKWLWMHWMQANMWVAR